MRAHLPVLYEEVLASLAPRAGGRYIDATLGGAGHAVGLLKESSPDGCLLGIDRDLQALAIAHEALAEFGDRAVLVQGSFAELQEIAGQCNFGPVEGIVMDLGLSTMQLTSPERGFSLQLPGSLDMRFDRSQELTADELVNDLSERELADLIYQYGEEWLSRRIARAIVQARPLHTTDELAAVVARAVRRRGRIHPATRTFMALRIAVNDELSALSSGLEQAIAALAPAGRLAVISFHSLEDRIVKNCFRQHAKPAEQGVTPDWKIVTAKPVCPTREEQLANPASRSAKLRVGEKLASTV